MTETDEDADDRMLLEAWRGGDDASGNALLEREGVAWFAHLVGMAFGVALGLFAGDEPDDELSRAQ